MRIVVLGGNGFVGRLVCELAQNAGHDVTSLSRTNGCDVRERTTLEAALRRTNPNAIVQCAAVVGSVHYGLKYGAEMLSENCQILLNVYKAVQSTCPDAVIINPLSNCCYPGDTDIQVESAWQAGPPHTSVLAYGTSRRLVYALAETYRRQFGVKSVNWLVANAYGPGDKTDPQAVHALNGLVIRLLQAQARRDRQFEIWGTGAPIREWVYVDDVARILVTSVSLSEQTEPINLAQRKGYSIREAAALIAQALDYHVEFVFRTDMPDGDPKKVLDDALFRVRYPDFKFTPIDVGLRKTIEYYKRVLFS